MIHFFEKGTDPAAPTLLLLHGTGGTERDLAAVGKMISAGSSQLGVRGNVSENGMARFFRRLSEGVFDEQDLIFRTGELGDFLDEAAEQYGFDRRHVVAVGYSNGANIAASLLFHREQALRGAVLLHPMVPRRGIKLPDLQSTQVFIGAGRNDPLCPPAESDELEQLLTGAGADVMLHWENNGHQLSRSEIEQAAKWFEGRF